jgi:hypothetical protein
MLFFQKLVKLLILAVLFQFLDVLARDNFSILIHLLLNLGDTKYGIWKGNNLK